MELKYLLIILTIACFTSCEPKEKAISKSEITAKVDSLVAIKLEDLNRQAMEDLDRRKSIEVKAKADSIVQAYIQSQTPATQPN